MKNCRQFLFLSTAAVITILFMAPNAFAVGVDYADPAGGWDYSYGGTFNAGVVDNGFNGGTGPAGYGMTNNTGALDGTWNHDQSDKWDGSAPGDPLSNLSDPINAPDDPLTGRAGTAPGGAGALVEGGSGTDYIRIQDAGNPEFYGWCQAGESVPFDCVDVKKPANNNRRVYFGHDMKLNGGVSDELIMTNTGVTISFRVKIPDDGPLDDTLFLEGSFDDADFNSNLEVDGVDFLKWQQNNGGFSADREDGDANGDFSIDSADYDIWEQQFGGDTPGTVGWFDGAPNGRGKPMTNGRGMINVVQNSPTNEDTMVGFSLVNSDDITTFCSVTSGALCSGSGSGGLIMNNLNGDVPTDNIDSESSGTLNILEQTDNDLNEWNEYWITLENNFGLAGNIEVNVYKNGSLVADTFQVTLAAPGNASYANEDNPYIEFGMSDNGGFGSMDLDFISYKVGIHTPSAAAAIAAASAAIPEPSSIALLALGAIGMSGLRRRRHS